jgi:hypothetical protein
MPKNFQAIACELVIFGILTIASFKFFERFG